MPRERLFVYGIMISYVLIPCKRELEKLERDSDNHSLSFGHCSCNNLATLTFLEKNVAKSYAQKVPKTPSFWNFLIQFERRNNIMYNHSRGP